MAETAFDPLDPVHRSDPHQLYHQMRAQEPVHCGTEPGTGRRLWFLTRYQDVQEALRHPDLSREPGRLPAELAAAHGAARDPARSALGLDRHLLNLDPPDHTRLRRLMTPAFGARTVAALEPRIQEITTELMSGIAQRGGVVDLIEALALPLPVIAIAELLGIPIDDQTQFRGWVTDMLHGSGEANRQAATAFAAYLDERIAGRRASPGADLLSQLIQAEERGDRLTHTELMASAFLLLVAGHETTVNLIGNGTLALLSHPGQLARLRAQPELIGPAVEEILRFNGPVEASTYRYSLADVDLGGTSIPRGEAVAPILLAANRDPAVFAYPDTLDLARDPNRHLAFGHGTHFCLGASLARLEGRIALDALVRRFPDLTLAVPPADLEWTRNFSIHGVRRLPVTLVP